MLSCESKTDATDAAWAQRWINEFNCNTDPPKQEVNKISTSQRKHAVTTLRCSADKQTAIALRKFQEAAANLREAMVLNAQADLIEQYRSPQNKK